jgi:pimeloyl-ACP methyl ester carboxylesterase
MTPLRGHDLARPDAVIRYWTAGPVDAPTVVLLHGATLDHRAWIPQIDALQDRLHVVVPDLRGHGVSTGHFDFGAAVDDALALLDGLPVERVVLVGLSRGGTIAQELVRREPDRVGGLVAADTTCNSAARHSFTASAGLAALRLHAMIAGDGFARQSARAIARSPQAPAVRPGSQRPPVQPGDRADPGNSPLASRVDIEDSLAGRAYQPSAMLHLGGRGC